MPTKTVGAKRVCVTCIAKLMISESYASEMNIINIKNRKLEYNKEQFPTEVLKIFVLINTGHFKLVLS